MGFNKINSISLTDQFVQQLEDLIISGELMIGEQLPCARDLAVRMGVSRPVVTAGLIELEKLGFVEIKPRSRVVVCDYRRKGTLETIGAIIRFNGGVMRNNELKSLIDIRRVMEKLCMEQVIKNATDQQLLDFKPYVEAIKSSDTPEECAEAVFTFHQELAILSQNIFLPLLYYSCKEESLRLWQRFIKFCSISEMYEIKLALYHALLARDVETATRDPKEFPDESWFETNG